jgi:hypothetical protein
MAAASSRDPRRSLIIGSLIAGVVLAALVMMVLIGVYIAFAPRSSNRDSWGSPPSVVALAPIHRVSTANS